MSGTKYINPKADWLMMTSSRTLRMRARFIVKQRGDENLKDSVEIIREMRDERDEHLLDCALWTADERLWNSVKSED